MKVNPYSETIMDECSGQVFENDCHKAFEQGYKAGIKEVVEWVEEHNFYCYENGLQSITETKLWQAKLEEWL